MLFSMSTEMYCKSLYSSDALCMAWDIWKWRGDLFHCCCQEKASNAVIQVYAGASGKSIGGSFEWDRASDIWGDTWCWPREACYQYCYRGTSQESKLCYTYQEKWCWVNKNVTVRKVRTSTATIFLSVVGYEFCSSKSRVLFKSIVSENNICLSRSRGYHQRLIWLPSHINWLWLELHLL